MAELPSATTVESAEEQWIEFIATLPGGDPVAQGLYNGPLALLADAIRAHRAGALGAAAVACRAAVESACFVALTTVRHRPGTYSYTAPRDLSGKLRRVEFQELLKATSERGLLPKSLIDQARTLQQERGDFVAHLASRQLKELLRVAELPPKEGGNWMRQWVSPGEVVVDIECTMAVIRTLIQWTQDQPAQPGPGHSPA